MMQMIFNGIMRILHEPIYLFDVTIALYCLPKLELILKAILRLLKKFARLFKSAARIGSS